MLKPHIFVGATWLFWTFTKFEVWIIHILRYTQIVMCCIQLSSSKKVIFWPPLSVILFFCLFLFVFFFLGFFPLFFAFLFAFLFVTYLSHFKTFLENLIVVWVSISVLMSCSTFFLVFIIDWLFPLKPFGPPLPTELVVLEWEWGGELGVSGKDGC